MNRNPFRKGVGFYEVMTTSYTSGTEPRTVDKPYSEPTVDKPYSKPSQMENFSPPPRATGHQEKVKPSTDDSPRNVGFEIKDSHSDRKKKYLTAKYGAHQMFLIKKRLGVEMWIFDELRKLYESENDDHDCELELEEILNLDTDSERRQYVWEQLEDAKVSKGEVSSFVDELLKKAKTL